MKIAVIYGTRPEVIKLSPVVEVLREKKIDFCLIHTGQHYSHLLTDVFYSEFNMVPDVVLQKFGFESSIQELVPLLKDRNITMVLVQGDTDSALNGCMAAQHLGIFVGHVEACLRSFDNTMKEEQNRVTIDALADLLFVPTEEAMNNLHPEMRLWSEGFLTGNTIADVLLHSRYQKPVEKNKHILLTLHRRETVDSHLNFGWALDGAHSAAKLLGMDVIFPVHPHTASNIKRFFSNLPDHISFIDPLSFSSFLILEKSASIILTDSGGVQEEACILGVPCVTLRTSTERQETLKLGCNVLVGYEVGRIAEAAAKMVNLQYNWEQPYGDGHSAERIVDIILNSGIS
jgi:UDP-N-acetylglucosamine 2-epimerase (non-hydrolysing)